MPTYSTLRGSETWYPYAKPALSRINSNSSVASDATAPNLPGAGRVMGLLLYGLGARFETFLNRRGARLHLGPEAVAMKMRNIRRHDEISVHERYASSIESLPERQKATLRRLCEKLVKYASARTLSTQLAALDEIVTLSVEDPIIRMMLGESDLNSSASDYREPDLIISASKALGSLENAKIHNVWTEFISSRGKSIKSSFLDFNGIRKFGVNTALEFHRELRIRRSLDPIAATLWDPEASYLGARYLSNLVNRNPFRRGSPRDPEDVKFWTITLFLWFTYIDAAKRIPHVIEWETMRKCLQHETIHFWRSFFRIDIPYKDDLEDRVLKS